MNLYVKIVGFALIRNCIVLMISWQYAFYKLSLNLLKLHAITFFIINIIIIIVIKNRLCQQETKTTNHEIH